MEATTKGRYQVIWYDMNNPSNTQTSSKQLYATEAEAFEAATAAVRRAGGKHANIVCDIIDVQEKKIVHGLGLSQDPTRKIPNALVLFDAYNQPIHNNKKAS